MVSPRLHILIVDDEPAHRKLAKRALLSSYPECIIFEAFDKSSALKVCADNSPQLSIAIIDYNLQEELGLTILEYIRGNTLLNSLPVIIQSTSELEADVRASYAGGANCYLVKSSEPLKYQQDLVKAFSFFIKK